MFECGFSKNVLIKVEPYWNVKSVVYGVVCVYRRIKVEPYWNVKDAYENEYLGKANIKVEPYWNVKIVIACSLEELV